MTLARHRRQNRRQRDHHYPCIIAVRACKTLIKFLFLANLVFLQLARENHDQLRRKDAPLRQLPIAQDRKVLVTLPRVPEGLRLHRLLGNIQTVFLAKAQEGGLPTLPAAQQAVRELPEDPRVHLEGPIIVPLVAREFPEESRRRQSLLWSTVRIQ